MNFGLISAYWKEELSGHTSVLNAHRVAWDGAEMNSGC
jgi:hypothetical protein